MTIENYLDNGWPYEITEQQFEDLKEFIKRIVVIKCKEQRKICADNADADYNFIGNRDENSHIEVYVLKESILNAPEPEM